MTSTQGPIVPDGQHPPFAVVTPDDHAAWIIIATALGLVTFLFFCFVRVVVRFTISHGLGMDDYVLYAATVLGVIQSSIILGACAKGLGKSLHLVSAKAQGEVQQMYYASNFFWLLAIGLSKISVICLLHRITRVQQHRRIFNGVMSFIAAWTIASIVSIALQCNLGHPWTIVNEKCPKILQRWQAFCIVDIIEEVTIVGLVVLLVFSLQTSVSSKATVVGVFSFRLFIIIFVGFRLHSFDQAGYTTNPFLRESHFIVWTQSELAFSLISATIPTFQSFLRKLNTGFGGIGAGESGYGSSSRSHPMNQTAKSYKMSKLRSANKSVGMEEPDEEQNRQAGGINGLTGKPDAITMVQWDGKQRSNGGTSIDSDESRRLMIRKEVQWNVSSVPRT